MCRLYLCLLVIVTFSPTGVQFKADVKTPIASGNYSQSTDNTGNTTQSGGGTVKIDNVDYGTTVSKTSNGTVSVGGNVSASNESGTKVQANATVNYNTNTGATSVSVGGSVQQKIKNTTVTNSASVTVTVHH